MVLSHVVVCTDPARVFLLPVVSLVNLCTTSFSTGLDRYCIAREQTINRGSACRGGLKERES